MSEEYEDQEVVMGVKEEDDIPSVEMYEDTVTTKKYSVFLDDCFESNQKDYRELLYMLDKASATDEVLIRLSSYGGDCHVGFQVCHAVKDCKAKTVIKVEQPCYSMGAVLACCAKKLIMNPQTFLMFHNYSGGSRGKGAEMMMSAKEQDAWLHRSFRHFCSPFLTDVELEKLHHDQDVYVRSWDASLKARMKKHFGGK